MIAGVVVVVRDEGVEDDPAKQLRLIVARAGGPALELVRKQEVSPAAGDGS
jgi:hypothetical protein